MNIEHIREILFELIAVLVGALWIGLQVRIVSDFFVARNPFLNWKIRIAKVIGFNRYEFPKTHEDFSVIEYQDYGKKIKSVVQRDLRDRIGKEIAISVSNERFTVRYKLYLPYKLLGKIFNAALGSGMLIGGVGYLWILGVAADKLLIAVGIGVIFGYFFHARYIYNLFYSPDCIMRKYLDGNLDKLHEKAIPIRPMGEGIIEDTDFNQLPFGLKCLVVFIWFLFAVRIISALF